MKDPTDFLFDQIIAVDRELPALLILGKFLRPLRSQ